MKSGWFQDRKVMPCDARGSGAGLHRTLRHHCRWHFVLGRQMSSLYKFKIIQIHSKSFRTMQDGVAVVDMGQGACPNRSGLHRLRAKHSSGK